ncbi:hypothetical protein E3N88_28738 [Mikania micrantha]|uniref:Uncharacterized protein n=1 Tax=Mikania micrantha TaxID=192012 RepID=A0A5N6N1G3_9ASTR|nr:hypothetical protein E3N88_28738 [Mikania micrantha]
MAFLHLGWVLATVKVVGSDSGVAVVERKDVALKGFAVLGLWQRLDRHGRGGGGAVGLRQVGLKREMLLEMRREMGLNWSWLWRMVQESYIVWDEGVHQQYAMIQE